MKRRLIIFTFCFAALLGVGKLSERRTDGFTVLKIRDNFSSSLLRSSSPDAEIKAILDQRFTYFKRGAQSFVFQSEDGNWVLKIFNNRLKKRLFWMELLPFSASKKSFYKKKWQQMFQSYAIASDEIPQETGVVFAHLSPNQKWSHRLTLVDAIGKEHHISSDECGFLIQKKAAMIYPCINASMKAGKTQEAIIIIHSLTQHIKRCHIHGVVNHDPSIRKNVGLYNDTCLTLDVGRFSIDERLKDPAVSHEETRRTLRRFRKWLVKTHPSLAQELQTLGY